MNENEPLEAVLAASRGSFISERYLIIDADRP